MKKKIYEVGFPIVFDRWARVQAGSPEEAKKLFLRLINEMSGEPLFDLLVIEGEENEDEANMFADLDESTGSRTVLAEVNGDLVSIDI